MQHLQHLLSPSYLFNVTPVITNSDKLFFLIGSISVVLAIILKLAALYAPTPIDKVVREKLYRLFLTIGILEILWFGAKDENVYVFGTHAMALGILLIGLIWFGFIVSYIIKNYRRERVTWEKTQVKLKYLPK